MRSIWSMRWRARRAGRARLAQRGDGLSRVFGLFSLSGWPDRNLHQRDKKDLRDQTDQMNPNRDG
jgi:hypothetical protein